MNARNLMVIDRREHPAFWRAVRQLVYADRINRRIKLKRISFQRITINHKQK